MVDSFGDYTSSQIQTGNGGSGGRGGDVGSHNGIKNSNNVNNITINHYGPQFIVSPEGNALDLSMADKGSVISHPFHGGSNQLWTLEDDGHGRVALKSKYNGTYVSGATDQQNSKLVATKRPFFWDIAQQNGGYKIIDPNTGLALGLSSAASLRPTTDKTTQVYVLEDTPENREAIKKGKIVPSKSLETSTQPSSGNVTVIVTGGSGFSIHNNAEGIRDLQKFLASDTSKNLVLFFGSPPVACPLHPQLCCNQHLQGMHTGWCGYCTHHWHSCGHLDANLGSSNREYCGCLFPFDPVGVSGRPTMSCPHSFSPR